MAKSDITGVRRKIAHKVSHSNIKTKKRQFPNLQTRQLWWVEGARFVTIKLSTRALRTVTKKGLDAYAAETGLDLARL